MWTVIMRFILDEAATFVHFRRPEVHFQLRRLQRNRDEQSHHQNIALQHDAKVAAEGNLGVTSTSLAEDEKTMSTLKQGCFIKSQDHAAETKSRSEELRALEEARTVVARVANGAASIADSFAQKSFLQLSQTGRSDIWSDIDFASFEDVLVD